MIQRVSAAQQRAEDAEGAAPYADQGWLYHLKRQTDDSCGYQSLWSSLTTHNTRVHNVLWQCRAW
jgi:hypothetical protein